MNPYEKTEVYLVTWQGGTCGAFITTLVNNLLFGEPSASNVVFSENGNSHPNHRNTNWTNKFSDKLYTQNVDHIYTHIIPIDSNKPLILFDHLIPNWEKLFSIFPNAKHVKITYSKNLVPLIEANLFYKYTIEEIKDYDSPETLKLWEKFKENKFPNVFDNIKNFNDITPDILEKLFSKSSHNPIHPYYSDDSTIPLRYTEKVFKIKMYDILTAKDIVLDQLSNITGKQPTIDINYIYDQYLLKQDELLRTKIPWFKL